MGEGKLAQQTIYSESLLEEKSKRAGVQQADNGRKARRVKNRALAK